MHELILPETLVVFDGKFFEWHRHRTPWSGQRCHVAHINALDVNVDKKGRHSLRFKIINGREENLGEIPEADRLNVEQLIAAVRQARAAYPSLG